MLKKDEVVAAMKKQLDELSAEIDALESRAHEVKEEARAKFQKQLVMLRAKRQEGEAKFEEKMSATESSWSRLKFCRSSALWCLFTSVITVLRREGRQYVCEGGPKEWKT